MANSSAKKSVDRKVVVERCWMLVGRRQGRFWYARRVKPSVGKPASVAFDAEWALAREEARGDVVGFYHTHPSGLPTPSKRDDRTMQAWVSCFAKPLLCMIEADGRAHAFLYEEHRPAAVELHACEQFPRGVVVVFDDRDWNIEKEEIHAKQVPA